MPSPPYCFASSAIPAIKITNDWQRVVNQDADARSEMVVCLMTEYRFFLRSQRDPECERVERVEGDCRLAVRYCQVA